MKKLVLTTIGDMKHAELASMFQSQGVTLVEREAHDGETKELIFYCSPESYLAFFNVPESDAVDKLTVWEKETLVQLDYVISNPERCLLIELEFAIQNPVEFNHYIKENLKIVLTENNMECFDTTKQIQSCILLIDDDIQDTYEEIAAAADLFNKEGNQSVIERLFLYVSAQQSKIDDIELLQLIHTEESEKENAKCAELEDELVTIKTEKEQCNVEITEVNTANELAVLQINQLQEELESALAEKEESQNKLNQEAENKINDLTVELKNIKLKFNNLSLNKEQMDTEKTELNSENKLAFLQINQLQEKLEAIFVDKEQSNVQHAKAINDTETKVNYLTIKLETAEAEKESLSVDKEQLNSEKSELNSENELALLQINQLQEELEALFVKKEHSLALYAEAINETETKVNALTGKFEISNAENRSLSLEKGKFNTEKSELNSENELVLLQISQLQEELEAIFTEKELSQVIHFKAINEAETKVHELTKKLGCSQTENTSLSQEKDHLNTTIAELNSEKELALLQINQLQEELEYYFMKLQSKNGQEIMLKTAVVNIFEMKTSLQLVKLLK